MQPAADSYGTACFPTLFNMPRELYSCERARPECCGPCREAIGLSKSKPGISNHLENSFHLYFWPQNNGAESRIINREESEASS